ncbi:Nramp family divalent metal transporter [Alicyclobacillus sp. ALC3]|uniref:Nramp family divalent metal transporter n=1 Tax=Alicyclobacillus sp. ALC3 TaxID=2796143 RepID=UPI00237823F3|nr:Nramp family divalent metal transporter [Alicyclobacillus sp. ALC3]WDL95578.1 Nramp family divalent metal transporter [Alicyclobacillus sp. ALC3]
MSNLAASEAVAGAESKAVKAGRLVLDGKRKGLFAVLPFLGPALIASVAYVDPGNYATNIQSGSEYGYRLLWVVVLANLMAMMVQTLSAKLGIATGRNLPELCRAFYPKWLTYTLWGVSEVAAMATDLAEFLGASLAINLLMHIPLLIATLVTGVLTYAMLQLERFGFRPLEIFIGALVGVIAISYLLETFISRPNWGLVASHAVTPWVGGSNSMFLVVGIIGATIMPHAVYLHSGLTQNRIQPRNTAEAKKVYGFERLDVLIAMTLAGLVNMAMMYMAASAFHGTGHTGIASISSAYRTLTPLLGPAAAAVFLVSLLASGLSSSAVGTMAGQMIMQGFVGFRIPLWVRRVATMLPAVAVVAIGLNATQMLVLSQVVLSIALPAPVIALVYFTSRKSLMGELVNRWWVTVVATLIACVIVLLNVYLIYTSLGG